MSAFLGGDAAARSHRPGGETSQTPRRKNPICSALGPPGEKTELGWEREGNLDPPPPSTGHPWEIQCPIGRGMSVGTAPESLICKEKAEQ